MTPITEEERGKLTKSEATRARIRSAALALFAEKGFGQTTMREIAAAADCSLGLAYRYFPTKDAMVLELYAQLVAEFAEEAAALPPVSLAERWVRATRNDLLRLQANRGALMGLTSAGLSPGSPTQVLGASNAALRQQMLAIFLNIVSGAKDAPKPAVAGALATLFYAAHLLLVLFWLQDPTPDQRITGSLVDFGEDLFARLRFLLRLPWVGGMIIRAGEILRPVFDGSLSGRSDAPARQNIIS